MKVRLVNAVILAKNYLKLVEWYKKVLNLQVLLTINKDYHYTELGQENEIIIGIAVAKEMGRTDEEHIETHISQSHVVIQIKVSDILELFEKVTGNSGKILFGPSVEDDYQYGAFADIEGNEIWVVEKIEKPIV